MKQNKIINSKGYWFLNYLLLVMINGILSAIISLIFDLDFIKVWTMSILWSVIFTAILNKDNK